MARATYTPEHLGSEVVAPAGYYQPLEEGLLDRDGRQVLYTRGTACIEASCCGVGSWRYLRVEGYLIERGPAGSQIDTVENENDRIAIRALLQKQYPEARIEFR